MTVIIYFEKYSFSQHRRDASECILNVQIYFFQRNPIHISDLTHID